MVSYGPKIWGVAIGGPQDYRVLKEISININVLSNCVSDQKLCLPKVGLPFLEPSIFSLTSNLTSRSSILASTTKYQNVECIPNPNLR
jgi:hypothetical protein